MGHEKTPAQPKLERGSSIFDLRSRRGQSTKRLTAMRKKLVERREAVS